MIQNPYDELPYKSLPIEWTAPERLALASLLHGGPRQVLDSNYRVLELGCGDGANLLPLAAYRPHATFVGIDGAQSQIQIADNEKSTLQLSNVDFIHSDFLTADKKLTGEFDYIIAHGVFSWVSPESRDALLALCGKFLRRGGLLYLNYNSLPGWNVRGMVRDFLLAQTANIDSLKERAETAQKISEKLSSPLALQEHPYSQLMANEFKFVSESHISYIAHEYLTVDNYAYWRSEFLELAKRYELNYVADADFNYSSGRMPEDLAPQLVNEQLIGRSVDDTVDLLCYRQLHSPILTRGSFIRHLPTLDEFSHLLIASCLEPDSADTNANPMFVHPSGFQVEAKTKEMEVALKKLLLLWPKSLCVNELFSDVSEVIDDLKLLQRNGLIELRCIESAFDDSHDSLNGLENIRGGYKTTCYHARETFTAEEINVNESSMAHHYQIDEEVTHIHSSSVA